MKTELAEKLKSWRAARGLSQSKAALALGVNLKTLQDWEQSSHSPRGIGLSALLARLNETEAA